MAIQLPPNSTGTTLDTITVGGKDRQIVAGPPRTAVTLIVDNIAAVATEALASYAGHRGGTALTAGTTAYTVTTGRALRVTSLTLWATGTALDRVRVRVRAIVPTVTAVAPIYAAAAVGVPANGAGQVSVSFAGDGVEIAAGLQIGISAVGATTTTYGAVLTGYEYAVV